MLQGPRMVRDVFRLAKENAPAIIFIDEVDAIATARFDAQTGADRCALVHCLFSHLPWRTQESLLHPYLQCQASMDSLDLESPIDLEERQIPYLTLQGCQRRPGLIFGFSPARLSQLVCAIFC